MGVGTASYTSLFSCPLPKSPLGPPWEDLGAKRPLPGQCVCFQTWIPEGWLWAGGKYIGAGASLHKGRVLMVRAAQSGSEGFPSKVLRLKGSSVGVAEWGRCLEPHVHPCFMHRTCPGIHTSQQTQACVSLRVPGRLRCDQPQDHVRVTVLLPPLPSVLDVGGARGFVKSMLGGVQGAQVVTGIPVGISPLPLDMGAAAGS